MELACELPPPGHIVSRSEVPELEATELVLSNGMRVSLPFLNEAIQCILEPWTVCWSLVLASLRGDSCLNTTKLH